MYGEWSLSVMASPSASSGQALSNHDELFTHCFPLFTYCPCPITYDPLPMTCFYTFPSFFNFLASFFSLRDLPGFFLLSFFTSLDFDMVSSSVSPPREWWFILQYQNINRLTRCKKQRVAGKRSAGLQSRFGGGWLMSRNETRPWCHFAGSDRSISQNAGRGL